MSSIGTLQAAPEPNMNEGEWEITTQMDIPGMPAAARPMSFRKCMKKGQAVPQQSEKNPECKMLEQTISGDTLTWKVRCENKHGRTDIIGSVTYSGDTMEGLTQMTSNQGAGGKFMKMNTKMKGRRIGPCK